MHRSWNFIDLTGKIFTRLSIIKELYTKGSRVYWLAKCSCDDKEVVVCGQDLHSGHTKSCGCLQKELARDRKFKDLTGQRFGRLLVQKFSRRNKYRSSLWWAICDCGITVEINAANLQNGCTQSCGCYNREQIGNVSRKHGFSVFPKHSPEKKFFNAWTSMRQRCLDKNRKDYLRYGGRGITVCPRWLESFENFKEDMWESFLKHYKEHNGDTSLDRILVNGNYELSNCKWSTWQEQTRNRQYSVKSENYGMHEECRKELVGFLFYITSNRKRKFSLKIINRCIEYFGCSPKQLVQHIESQFESWMNWDNRGALGSKDKVWQLDHMVEINKFDLFKEEDRKKCFYFSNFKPILASDNSRKR